MHRTVKRIPVEVAFALDGAPVGMTRDLSVRGAFVHTDQRPAVGSQHQMAVGESDGTAFGCLAHVVRHGTDGIAMEFDHCSGDFDRHLLHLMGPEAIADDDLKGR